MEEQPPRRKVFCIGLGKTGTTTFGAIMKQNGYRHKTGPFGEGLKLARIKAYDELFKISDQYDSLDDFPWPYLYEQASARYPDARFVLTKRAESNAWFESLNSHNLRLGPTDAQLLAYGCYIPQNNKERLIKLYENHISAARNFFAGTDKYIEVCWSDKNDVAKLTDFLGLHDLKEIPHKNATSGQNPKASIDALIKEGRGGHAILYAESIGSDMLRYTERQIRADLDKKKRFKENPIGKLLRRFSHSD